MGPTERWADIHSDHLPILGKQQKPQIKQKISTRIKETWKLLGFVFLFFTVLQNSRERKEKDQRSENSKLNTEISLSPSQVIYQILELPGTEELEAKQKV